MKDRKSKPQIPNSAAAKIPQAPTVAKINSKDRLPLSKGDTDGFC